MYVVVHHLRRMIGRLLRWRPWWILKWKMQLQHYEISSVLFINSLLLWLVHCRLAYHTDHAFRNCCLHPSKSGHLSSFWLTQYQNRSWWNVNGTRDATDDAKSVSAQSLSKNRKNNDFVSVSIFFLQPPKLKKLTKNERWKLVDSNGDHWNGNGIGVDNVWTGQWLWERDELPVKCQCTLCFGSNLVFCSSNLQKLKVHSLRTECLTQRALKDRMDSDSDCQQIQWQQFVTHFGHRCWSKNGETNNVSTVSTKKCFGKKNSESLAHSLNLSHSEHNTPDNEKE